MTSLRADRGPAGVVRRAVLPLLLLVVLGVTGNDVTAVATTGGASGGGGACARPAQGFVPTRARIPAIGRTLRVIQVRRTANGRVGAGPVTTAGKWLMAMDPKTRPASGRGTVLLSGHTWPDGSALGNAMLAGLWPGDGVVLVGKNGKRACYRITQRVSYPANRVPRKVLRSGGPEQLVIVSCSGKRLGPGRWTRRMVWYGVPAVPQATPPPASPQPPPPSSPPKSGSSGLLGLLGL